MKLRFRWKCAEFFFMMNTRFFSSSWSHPGKVCICIERKMKIPTSLLTTHHKKKTLSRRKFSLKSHRIHQPNLYRMISEIEPLSQHSQRGIPKGKLPNKTFTYFERTYTHNCYCWPQNLELPIKLLVDWVPVIVYISIAVCIFVVAFSSFTFIRIFVR